MKELILAAIFYGALFLFGGIIVLVLPVFKNINSVEVPAQVEIRSDLYRVLHEDILTVNGMKIKRVYYEIK
jgi:hypothetical protein